MMKTLGNFVLFIWSKFKITSNLAAENLALRQQLVVMKRANKRPKIRMVDRLFWVVLFRIWRACKTGGGSSEVAYNSALSIHNAH